MAWRAGLALRAAIALCFAMSSSAEAAALAKPRVATVSVCGDLYTLMLADRSQIASLSAQADGPLAWYPDRARGLPRNRGDLESLLAARADLVLMEEGDNPQLARALAQVGIRTVILPDSADFPDVARTVETVADALGQHARGKAVAGAMRRRVEALQADRPPETRRPIALYFRPDGGGAADGTFINGMMELAGFRNLQVLQGQRGWTNIPLEAIVENPPQVFITGFFDTQSESLIAVRGSKLAIIGAAHAPVISLSSRGMVCASPALVAVAEQAAAMRRRLFPERAHDR